MKLNYRRYSEQGEPVLIMHGLFGSLSNWGWHSKQLAEHFSVVAVDLRNHGESPHEDAMNYQDMADDVIQLLDDLGIEKCSLIGHSMGGKTAMQLALSYPDRVNKLIVVDIAPSEYTGSAEDHMRIISGMRSLDMTTVSNRNDADKHLQDYVEDEATRQFILTNLARAEDGTFSWRLNLDALEKHYDRLREKLVSEAPFTGPTLFVRGDLSPYVRKKHEAEILELFPNASVKSVMETGHWVHAEKPQVFQTIALGFLNQESVPE